MSAVPWMNVQNIVPAAASSAHQQVLQELWFATRRRNWKSLVLVPASPGRSAFPLANALGETGEFISRSPVHVINAEGMDLDQVTSVATDLSGAAARSAGGASERGNQRSTIVSIDAVTANPLALGIALAADAVLVCIELGGTNLDVARRTIEMIGRDRIVGSVLLD